MVATSSKSSVLPDDLASLLASLLISQSCRFGGATMLQIRDPPYLDVARVKQIPNRCSQ